MQNNCNPLIPWKTFLMRKIWQFSAPGKRNLGLVMPGADVAVPGLCLSDYWAFWTPGTLAAAAAAAPLWEGGDRKGRRKESSGGEEWICCVFSYQDRSLCVGFVQSLLGFQRCHLVSSPPTDTNPLWPLRAQASPRRPHSRGWLLCQVPVGMWVPALSRNKAPEKSKWYKKMQNPISKSRFHCSIELLHVIPFICVYLQCVKCSLWKEPEALQHQRSLGMHPLSGHTPPPTHAHPTPQAKAPKRANEAASHCSPHFW